MPCSLPVMTAWPSGFCQSPETSNAIKLSKEAPTEMSPLAASLH